MAEMIKVLGYWDNRGGNCPNDREPLVHVMATDFDGHLQSIGMTADEARKMADSLMRAAAFIMEPEQPKGEFEEVIQR